MWIRSYLNDLEVLKSIWHHIQWAFANGSWIQTKGIYTFCKCICKHNSCTNLMFNEGLVLHYTRKNVEWEEALRCTHACFQKLSIYNGSKQERCKLHVKWFKFVFLDIANVWRHIDMYNRHVHLGCLKQYGITLLPLRINTEVL